MGNEQPVPQKKPNQELQEMAEKQRQLNNMIAKRRIARIVKHTQPRVRGRA